MISLKNLKTNEPLARHTSFGIGGPADYFFVANNTTALAAAIQAARSAGIKFLILGGGSNVLISDKGFRGLVIKNQARSVSFKTGGVEADSGINLNQLIKLTVAKGLSGLEYFAGIPGSLGGALFNNAHYHEHLIGTAVVTVEVLDKAGQRRLIPGRDCRFSYEFSRFQTSGEIILRAGLKLMPGDKTAIDKIVKAAIDYRRQNHPQEKSAGCIFQNPPDVTAAELIDRAGLKGKRIGGAMISPKHAGFIINTDGARAEDVLKLIKLVKQQVKLKFKLDLKEEIFLMGES